MKLLPATSSILHVWHYSKPLFIIIDINNSLFWFLKIRYRQIQMTSIRICAWNKKEMQTNNRLIPEKYGKAAI